MTRLVSCPTISIDPDESAEGFTHLLSWVLITDFFWVLFSLYDNSSRFDHLDRGEVPTKSHNSEIYWFVD